MRRRYLGLFSLAFLFFVSSVVYGAVPQTINYQGYLKDASGPVNGTVSMTFKLYDVQSRRRS